MISNTARVKDSQRELLEKVALLYQGTKDYDIVNTKLAASIICPECCGKDVLEVGCAGGEMTEDLLESAKSLTVIEPAERFCRALRDRFGGRLKVYNAFVEDLAPDRSYDVAVLASLLHHIPEPGSFLRSLKRFLTADGQVLATVPNALSLHRQVGVRAGLLKDEFADSERNRRFHQITKFTKESLCALFVENSYEVEQAYGYMLKPFSSEQMLQLKLDWKVMLALFEIGKENQHLASQLFVKAGPLK